MTENRFNRRQILSLSVGIFAGLAGCGEEQSRTLAFPPGREFSETSSGEWVGDVRVEYQKGLAGKPEWEAFHNVQVRGFDVNRELVCITDYGDIPAGETRVREVRCDRFPSILVLTADESPCEDGTYIEYLVYTENYNGNFVWDGTSFRGCNEEIPPEGDVQPVTPTETPDPTATPAASNSPTTSPTRNRTRTTPSSVSDSEDN